MSLATKPAKRGTMTALALRMHLRDVVPRLVRQDNRAAKVLARDTGVTDRTIEGIRNEGRLPGMATCLALAKAIPELKAELRRVLEMEQDCDPEAERAFIDLMRAGMKILEDRANRIKTQGAKRDG